WKLRERGSLVDIVAAEYVDSVKPYTAVVLGSPIYHGRWLPEAMDFLRLFDSHLRRIPVAFFVTGISQQGDREMNRQRMRSSIAPAIRIVRPVSVGMFAGHMDHERLSWGRRMLLKFSRSSEGNYRDFEEIRSWATDLSVQLQKHYRLV
ncbi:MAG TPA: flavodoxin domain-containing protein, partial [Methanomicrobiales archaeon]|nr:flavodoxin domain-containing protein [Methanomicrobiales archaeon]